MSINIAVETALGQLNQLEQKQADDMLHDFVSAELLSIKLENLPTQEDRVAHVEKITESYYVRYGEHVNQKLLAKLSDYLLLDYLRSKKHKTDENQFHTVDQLYYRKKKEFSVEADTLSFISARNSYCMPQRRRTKEVEEYSS